MSVVNDFQPFAVNSAANVLTQSQYVALTSVIQDGFTTGTAYSNQVNKVLRQASIASYLIGQLINSELNLNANDDGNLTTLQTNFQNALLALASPVYAALNGSASNVFNAAASTASTNQVVPRNQADTLYAAINGSPTVTFQTANATVASDAVNLSQLNSAITGLGSLYAALNGSATQTFNVANPSSGTQALNLSTANGLYAAVAGNSGQAFNVANAATATEAVALGQMAASLNSSGLSAGSQSSITIPVDNGGTLTNLIIKFGLTTQFNSESGQTVTFTTPFPTGCFHAQATMYLTTIVGQGNDVWAQVYAVTASSLGVYCQSSSSAGVAYPYTAFWLAIGT